MAEKLSRPMSEAGLDEFDKWYNDHRELTGSLTRTYIACRAAWRAASESTPAESTLERIKSYIAGEQGSHKRQRDRDEILHDIWQIAAAHSQWEQALAPEDGGFEKAVLDCNLAGPEAFATDENGRYRYDQMRSLEQFWRAASEITQAPANWIPVSERLPEMDGTWYLTFRSGYDAANDQKNGIDVDTAQGQAMWYTKQKKYPFGISHWMPLPNSPDEQAAAHSQREQDVIPGIAGQSPCAGCGKGMDGAFDSVSRVGGKWYHENCISQREQTPAPEQPKCDCGAGDDAYLACHADVCSLRKWANPASEARSQAAQKEVMPNETTRLRRAVTGDCPSGERDSERRSQAAREIVEAFNDRGRTYDNSPDEAGVLAILDRCLSGEQ